jgi:Tol biopolymer transport system component
MKLILVFLLSFTFVSLLLKAQHFDIKPTELKSPFILNAHQITFVGPRSGEGYFSADGEEIIFQSERFDGNPFYQIYKTNIKSGKTDLISTGKGQTTCAWIHPSKQKVIFSSTHLDPEFEAKVKAEFALRQQPTQKYSWNFDSEFEIFEKNLKTNTIINLTHTKGYDAESSYSPDGKWIAFASNRNAYNQKLSEEDQKHFDADNSYMMDIFIMKADGTEVKQLTDVKGYDGGPFFSADGKKITWRRFSSDGRSAEIYTMNVDGSEQKPITQLKSMSWAPFFHPSGKYIIFTTNLQGFSNFELYIVDTQGLKEPIRVTFEDGFDGLPVFSPNGNQISWTKRNAKGESQIFIAEWDHEGAMQALDLQGPTLDPKNLSSNIETRDLKQYVHYLTSKNFQGRATGSPQEKIYSKKFVELFKKWGLDPAPSTIDYINSFDFFSDVKLGSGNELKIDGKIMTLGKDWNPISYSQSAHLEDLPIVFAGYGILAPATEKFSEYNSYKNLDVKDKWVLVFRDIPNDVLNEKRYHLNFYSRIQHKVTVAKNLGAKGLIIVSGPRSAYKQKLPRFQFEGSLSDSSILIMNIDDSLGEAIMKKSGRTLEEVQKQFDDGSAIEGFAIPNIKISAKIAIEQQHSEGRNAIAMINVKGAKDTITIGAHGDHLGLGLPGVSLATADMTERIHYGADDNASGVSIVLELAHYFSQHKNQLKNNLIFAIWSGEELGNLGSKNYLQSLKKGNISQHNKAYLNLDMVGRLREHLYVQGIGSSLEWKTLLEKLAINTTGFNLVPQEDPYLPTDAMSFYVEDKVPVISLFTGSHLEYHTPLDTEEKINFDGMLKIADFTKVLIQTINSEKLSYHAIESNKRNQEARRFKIYLGTIPDYTQEGVKGVKISGTSQKSPAEIAGLKSNDIIISLGGQKIENIYDFTYALQMIKAGAETEIKIIRSQNKLSLKIIPAMKE